MTFRDQAYRVATQVPGLDDHSLEDAKRLVGVDYRGARAEVEITEDNVRDFCNYMGSENPLFLDASYAAATRWGGIVAPPAMVGQAIIAPGLRGIQWIYAGIEWEFYRVMQPGDVISQRGRLLDAVGKKGEDRAAHDPADRPRGVPGRRRSAGGRISHLPHAHSPAPGPRRHGLRRQAPSLAAGGIGRPGAGHAVRDLSGQPDQVLGGG